ncbi:hypothetical protein M3Y99_01465300 [Aphelenchoides fujianensis]|nr:hypothetical protein M3Y99_01465300 [Aphelenchoides fujianensis]
MKFLLFLSALALVLVFVPSTSAEEDVPHTRAERFVAYSNGFQVDYSLLILGIIISIVLSILLSLLCCFLCNSCWLQRRRGGGPHDYRHDPYEQSVNSGFYPLCCGFGVPFPTIVFSNQPPRFEHTDGDLYGGSASTYTSRSNNRVRFDEHGQPRSVLKNGSYT